MDFDIKKVSGIGEFVLREEVVDEKPRTVYFKGEKAFLVVNKNTIEVRCDVELKRILTEKYESVMESRYFGRGGVEIVMAGQFEDVEVFDLVRLSYNLT